MLLPLREVNTVSKVQCLDGSFIQLRYSEATFPGKEGVYFSIEQWYPRPQGECDTEAQVWSYHTTGWQRKPYEEAAKPGPDTDFWADIVSHVHRGASGL